MEHHTQSLRQKERLHQAMSRLLKEQSLKTQVSTTIINKRPNILLQLVLQPQQLLRVTDSLQKFTNPLKVREKGIPSCWKIYQSLTQWLGVLNLGVNLG